MSWSHTYRNLPKLRSKQYQLHHLCCTVTAMHHVIYSLESVNLQYGSSRRQVTRCFTLRPPRHQDAADTHFPQVFGTHHSGMRRLMVAGGGDEREEAERNGQRRRNVYWGDGQRKGKCGASGQRRLADATSGERGGETKESIREETEKRRKSSAKQRDFLPELPTARFLSACCHSGGHLSLRLQGWCMIYMHLSEFERALCTVQKTSSRWWESLVLYFN